MEQVNINPIHSPQEIQQKHTRTHSRPRTKIKKMIDPPTVNQLESDSLKGSNEGENITKDTKTNLKSNSIEVKIGNRRKLVFIALGIVLVIGFIILGMALGGVFDGQKQLKVQQPTTIKLPQSYYKYESAIMAGQEQNIIPLINIPKSQKIYNYKLINEQITTTGEGKVKVNKSVIKHKFGILCSDVTEKDFEMFLYFIETTKESEEENISQRIVGFPEIIELENNAKKQNRFTQEEEKKENNLESEYSPLNEEEIKQLLSKGITEGQFNQSRYPIVKFRASKQGDIIVYYEPINLRYDLGQIYMNLIDQISPFVSSEIYDVVKIDENNKKRILKEKEKEHIYRNLNGDLIKAKNEAIIGDNGKSVLLQEEKDKKNSSEGSSSGMENDYKQNIVIENGSLLKSSIIQKFQMNEENNNGMSLFQKLEQISEVQIEFVKQEDTVDELFLSLLHQYYDKMTVLNIDKSQANKRKNNTPKDNENTENRLLADVANTGQSSQGPRTSDDDLKDAEKLNQQAKQPPKAMGEPIVKPIFRQSFASIEFGADLKSECIESGFINQEDVCKVGLYSFFNGNQTKIYEKETRVNISKLLKYYQYIQYTVMSKMGGVSKTLTYAIDRIVKRLSDILEKVEELIDVEKNPVLKEVNKAINEDTFDVMRTIELFENMINTQLNNIQSLISDPFNQIKGRIFGFLQQSEISIESQINSIQNFYTDKLQKILDFITKNKKEGISQEIFQKIKHLLDNYDIVIIQILDEPIKKMLDEVEKYLLQKGNEIFQKMSQVDEQISSKAEEMIKEQAENIKATSDQIMEKSKMPNFIKKMFSTSFIIEKLQSVIKGALQKIKGQFDIAEKLSSLLRKGLSMLKNRVLDELNTVVVNKNAQKSIEFDQIFEQANNVLLFSQDVYAGLQDMKKNVSEIITCLHKIQEQSTSKAILQFTKTLIGFPQELALKLKKQAVNTVQKIKEFAIKIKENSIEWKDGLVQASRDLLFEVKSMYNELKGFLKKPVFPENDVNYYKEPLFSEIKGVVKSVIELADVRFNSVIELVGRFKRIPEKLTTFVQQVKGIGKNSMKYFDRIKVAVHNVKAEGDILWDSIKDRGQKVQNTFNNAFNVIKTVTKGVTGFQKEEDIFDECSVQGRCLEEMAFEVDFGDTFANLQDSSEEFIEESIPNTVVVVNSFKDTVSSESEDTSQIYNQLIKGIINQLSYEKKALYPAFIYPVQYVYVYKLKIATIKLELFADWIVILNVNIAFKNAILDLSTGINTKVKVTGKLTLSAGIGSIGGVADGVLLDTQLTAGINVKPLEKFKGSIYIDGQFTPYKFRLGAFWGTSEQKQVVKCETLVDKAKNIKQEAAKNGQSAKDLIAKGAKTVANKAVGSVKNSVANIMSGNVESKEDTGLQEECKSILEDFPKRDYLFGPYDFIGETYKKRIGEFKW